MKRPNKNIKNQLKAIRPFVKFNYDLRRKISPQSIAKIKRYHKELRSITYSSKRIYRPRIKSHLQSAIIKAGIKPEFKQLKAIPLPTTDEKAKVSIDNKGNMLIKEKNIDIKFTPIDPKSLIKNPRQYAKQILLDNPKAKRFMVKVGKYYLSVSFERDTFANGLVKLMKRYKTGKSKREFANSVIRGIETTNYKRQTSYEQFQIARKGKLYETRKRQQKRKPKKKTYATAKGRSNR